LLSVNDLVVIIVKHDEVKFRQFPTSQYAIDKLLFPVCIPDFSTLPFRDIITVSSPVYLV